ncbi:MAG: bifunctional metallophosphatase/5'-nucleotidase [Planctomycetes bacterium]|nr:bifunctional metallophosphatase/5'-nucleotidase [Planctomycetota bacterium]
MNTARNRIVAFFASAALVLCFLAGRGAGASGDEVVKFVILHSNDLHGQLLPRPARGRANEQMGGAAAIDAAVRRERAEAEKAGARLLLIDSGDWYQGTPEGNFVKDGVTGALMVEWMNRAGYDAAVIGNHDFDFGVANLMALMAKAKFTVLGANILNPVAGGPKTADGHSGSDGAESKPVALAPIAKPYAIYEFKGVKLAVIGLLTADTPRMVAEGRLGNITIPDEIAEARKWVDRASKEADIVILATHCGADIDKRLAEAVPEVPVILGGHSHTFIRQPSAVEHEPAALKNNEWKPGHAAKTYIVQSGSKAENLDRIEIAIDPKDKKIDRIDTRNLELYIKEYGEYAETKQWIASETAAVAKEMDAVVAEIREPESDAPKGWRTDPTWNLATESILWRARRIDKNVSMAFNNSTGIRTKIAVGKLTKRQIYEILPFDNTIVIFTVTGGELLALLDEIKGNPVVAGLEGEARRGPDGRLFASGLRVGGQVFEAKATYRIAANSFIAAGKGGFTPFEKGRDRNDTGIVMRDALLDYAAQLKTIQMDDRLRVKVEHSAAGRANEPEPATPGAGDGKKNKE